ncbi:MAG: DUF167 domain-containing protein [archaeon]
MDVSNYIKNGLLRIYVKPNSNKTEITGYDENKRAVKFNVSEPADKDKANKEIIRFFSKLLKRRVIIKSGLRSKEKTLKIA